MDAVCKEVYRRFPEVKGAKPETRSQGKNTLMIFKSRATAADGRQITHIVRAVVDPDGKIIKISASR